MTITIEQINDKMKQVDETMLADIRPELIPFMAEGRKQDMEQLTPHAYVEKAQSAATHQVTSFAKTIAEGVTEEDKTNPYFIALNNCQGLLEEVVLLCAQWLAENPAPEKEARSKEQLHQLMREKVEELLRVCYAKHEPDKIEPIIEQMKADFATSDEHAFMDTSEAYAQQRLATLATLTMLISMSDDPEAFEQKIPEQSRAQLEALREAEPIALAVVALSEEYHAA